MTELDASLYANLNDAFVAEATAVQRYTYFAEIAQIEGHGEISALFRDVAESLDCVSHGHLDFLQQVADPTTGRPIGETSLNLAAAVTAELLKANEVYPRLARAAHADGLADVASWMETLRALKKVHAAKLDAALARLCGPAAARPQATFTNGGTPCHDH